MITLRPIAYTSEGMFTTTLDKPFFTDTELFQITKALTIEAIKHGAARICMQGVDSIKVNVIAKKIERELTVMRFRETYGGRIGVWRFSYSTTVSHTDNGLPLITVELYMHPPVRTDENGKKVGRNGKSKFFSIDMCLPRDIIIPEGLMEPRSIVLKTKKEPICV